MSRVMIRKIKYRIEQSVKRGYWYNDVKFKDCAKFASYNTFETEIVNLGSTSAIHAFDYAGLPYKTANWALSTNPLAGDYEVLKNYYSYLKEKDSVVILPLCPFSSLSGSYMITDDRYYVMLYPSSIPNFTLKKQQQIKSEFAYPLGIYPALAILNDMKHVFRKEKPRTLSEEEMKSDAARWMQGWKKEFSIEDFSYNLSLKNKDGIKDAIDIVNKIISFCKERDIRLVILYPPVYHTLGELLTPSIRKTIIDSIIDKIDTQAVYYHNYLDDADFANDGSLFSNSFLMNKKGARMFTHRVLNDIGYKI
jgi:hypothetical protein